MIDEKGASAKRIKKEWKDHGWRGGGLKRFAREELGMVKYRGKWVVAENVKPRKPRTR